MPVDLRNGGDRACGKMTAWGPCYLTREHSGVDCCGASSPPHSLLRPPGCDSCEFNRNDTCIHHEAPFAGVERVRDKPGCLLHQIRSHRPVPKRRTLSKLHNLFVFGAPSPAQHALAVLRHVAFMYFDCPCGACGPARAKLIEECAAERMH